MERVQYFFLWILPFLFSLCVHEWAHAWMANRKGDPTTRLMGRLTLNPWPHIDILGTLLLPSIAFFSQSFMIGWAKPVPIQSRNFKHPLKDSMMVAAAGPLSNLILAILFAFLLKGLTRVDLSSSFQDSLIQMVGIGIQLNILLAIFNLFPLPPLDGGHILVGLFPPLQTTFSKIEPYGFFILLALFMTGIFQTIVFLPMNVLYGLILKLAG